VPGFVLHKALSVVVPRRKDDKDISFLKFLVYSSINYALWSGVIYIVYKKQYWESHAIQFVLLWFVVLVISPIVLGLSIGFISQKGWIRKFLQKIGINTLHPVSAAWDYYFSSAKPVWILITLQDDSEIAGFWGGRSFASSDPDTKDIYIQSVYRVVEDGSWKKVERTAGIWVDGKLIKSIEFKV
jgi:hypothetical protein